MRYYAHDAKIEVFDTEEEARAAAEHSKPRKGHPMKCQLARIVAENPAWGVYHGWYLWVEATAPVSRRGFGILTRRPMVTRLRYGSPYRTQKGEPILFRPDQLELLPVFADVTERPFEEWVRAGGEPPPSDILT